VVDAGEGVREAGREAVVVQAGVAACMGKGEQRGGAQQGGGKGGQGSVHRCLLSVFVFDLRCAANRGVG
jgi:hypothetical protein